MVVLLLKLCGVVVYSAVIWAWSISLLIFQPWRSGGVVGGSMLMPWVCNGMKASLLSGYRGCVVLCRRSSGAQNQFQAGGNWWQCCCSPGRSHLPVGQLRPGSVWDNAVQLVCFHCMFLTLLYFFFQQSHCRFDLIFLLNWRGFNYPPEKDWHFISNRIVRHLLGERGEKNCHISILPCPLPFSWVCFHSQVLFLLLIQFENSKINQGSFM